MMATSRLRRQDWGGLFRDMQREQTINGSQADIAALKG